MKRSVAWSKTASDKLFACSQTVSRIRAKAPPPAAGMNRKHAPTRSTLTEKGVHQNDLCGREPMAASRSDISCKLSSLFSYETHALLKTAKPGSCAWRNRELRLPCSPNFSCDYQTFGALWSAAPTRSLLSYTSSNTVTAPRARGGFVSAHPIVRLRIERLTP